MGNSRRTLAFRHREIYESAISPRLCPALQSAAEAIGVRLAVLGASVGPAEMNNARAIDAATRFRFRDGA